MSTTTDWLIRDNCLTITIPLAKSPDVFTIELPWPTSKNAFHRRFLLPGRKRPSTCISQEGRDFYAAIGRLLIPHRLKIKTAGPVVMMLDLYPPTRAHMDIDGRITSTLDSLKRRPKDAKQIPGCWIFADDDSQVRDLRVVFRTIVPGGKAVVTIAKLARETQGEMF